jgi:hypothetical protein
MEEDSQVVEYSSNSNIAANQNTEEASQQQQLPRTALKLEFIQVSATGEIMEKIQFAYMSLGQNCGAPTILDAISSLIQLSSNNTNNL